MKQDLQAHGESHNSNDHPFEKQLSLLVINAGEPLAVVDKELKIIAFNRQFKEQYATYFGAEVEKGRSVLDYARLIDRSELEEIFKNVLAGGSKEVEMEKQLPGKERTTFLLKYKPAYNEQDEIIGACVVFADITENVTARKLLTANAARYHQLLESISDAFLVFDENLCYTYVNKRAAELLRRDADAMIGKNVWDLFPEAVGSATYRALNKALTEKVPVIDVDYFAPLDLWMENRFYPSENGVSLFLRNITDQVKAEQAFMQSHKLLKKLTEKVPVAVYQFEMDAEDKMTFPFMSQAIRQLLPAIDVQALKLDAALIFKWVHPQDLERLVSSIYASKANLGEWNFEFRMMNELKGLIWVKGSARPEKRKNGSVAWYGYLQNITEQKLADERLRIAKERYDLVAQATHDAIYDWDLVKDEVLRTGDGLQVLFGYNPEEVNAQSDFWKSRVHPDDLGVSYNKLNAYLLDSNKNLCSHEYRFRRADGSYATVYDKGYIIRDAEGKAIRLIGATQDISPIKEAEVQLTALNETLEKRAQELARSNTELEQFAYIASHDLQEPLRMVTSFLVLLEDEYTDALSDTARQYIHFATEGAVRMRKVIQDLLEYSHVGKECDMTEEVNTGKLLKEAIHVNGLLISEKNAQVDSGPLPVLRGNTALLQQVFHNLLGNALKYQKAGIQPKVKISAQETEGHWQFSVADNGIGIDPQFFDKIFVVFQRLHTKKEFSGTGIGLAICKKIVESHNGSIWVESAPEKGSTFFFTIPKGE